MRSAVFNHCCAAAAVSAVRARVTDRLAPHQRRLAQTVALLTLTALRPRACARADSTVFHSLRSDDAMHRRLAAVYPVLGQFFLMRGWRQPLSCVSGGRKAHVAPRCALQCWSVGSARAALPAERRSVHGRSRRCSRCCLSLFLDAGSHQTGADTRAHASRHCWCAQGSSTVSLGALQSTRRFCFCFSCRSSAFPFLALALSSLRLLHYATRAQGADPMPLCSAMPRCLVIKDANAASVHLRSACCSPCAFRPCLFDR